MLREDCFRQWITMMSYYHVCICISQQYELASVIYMEKKNQKLVLHLEEA